MKFLDNREKSKFNFQTSSLNHQISRLRPLHVLFASLLQITNWRRETGLRWTCAVQRIKAWLRLSIGSSNAINATLKNPIQSLLVIPINSSHLGSVIHPQRDKTSCNKLHLHNRTVHREKRFNPRTEGNRHDGWVGNILYSTSCPDSV